MLHCEEPINGFSPEGTFPEDNVKQIFSGSFSSNKSDDVLVIKKSGGVSMSQGANKGEGGRTLYQFVLYNFSGNDPDIRESYATNNFAKVTNLRDNQNYVKVVACENLAGLVSESSNLTFRTWLDAPLSLSIDSPPNNYATSKTFVELNFSTNKHTTCNYGITNDNITIPVDEQYSKKHQKIFAGLTQEGRRSFYLECNQAGRR